jgi:hypothetical protein
VSSENQRHERWSVQGRFRELAEYKKSPAEPLRPSPEQPILSFFLPARPNSSDYTGAGFSERLPTGDWRGFG